MRPKLLDLFCGAGGAAMGYFQAGFDVVGIDIEPQPRYPFEFHQADALEVLTDLAVDPFWLARECNAIHASPPCQDYSTALRHLSAPHPRLIEPTRELLKRTRLPWVIENVPGAPLPRQDTLDGSFGVELCGTQFALRVWRHRLFETSFPVTGPPRSCSHVEPGMNTYNGRGRDRIYEEYGKQNPDPIWNNALGVPWMNGKEGGEAIPPAFTYWIGTQLLTHVDVKVAA